MTDRYVAAEECTSLGAPGLTLEAYPNRLTNLGTLPIRRALPIRDRRMVGPWCFLDCFGPFAFTAGTPMDVPPHPHIGLQTVSWLLEGEVRHSDSLGFEAVVRPGGVNVMTAGRGIAHAEETPASNTGRLSGVQLWLALPGEYRDMEPAFLHVEQVPVLETRGALVSVFAGSLGPANSAPGVDVPDHHFSPVLGADIQLYRGESAELELDPAFEHAIQVLEGDCSLEGKRLDVAALHYLGARRASVTLSSEAGGRILLIGGTPFPEKILMWWNFVARTTEEIAAARADWEAGERFGEVVGVHGPRLDAPELVRFAPPNPAS